MATAPLSNLTATWNASGTTFTGLKLDVTDTASAAGSLLMDLQVGGASKFNVSKTSVVTQNANADTPPTALAGTLLQLCQADTTVNRAVFESFGSGTQIIGRRANGTNAAKTTLVNGNSLIAVNGFGYDGTAYTTGRGGINLAATETWTNASHGTRVEIQATGTGQVAAAVVATFLGGGGLTVGSATGGDQGAGTINATAVYDDGVLLTCYVLEHWIDGAINIEAWNARVPDKEIAAVVVDGQETEPARTETRQHLPARGFAQVADARLDIDQFRQFLTDNRRLPAFPGPDRWADMFNGKMSTGDVLQRLWETVEVLAVHSCKARERELALEARIAALENRT